MIKKMIIKLLLLKSLIFNPVMAQYSYPTCPKRPHIFDLAPEILTTTPHEDVFLLPRNQLLLRDDARHAEILFQCRECNNGLGFSTHLSLYPNSENESLGSLEVDYDWLTYLLFPIYWGLDSLGYLKERGKLTLHFQEDYLYYMNPWSWSRFELSSKEAANVYVQILHEKSQAAKGIPYTSPFSNNCVDFTTRLLLAANKDYYNFRQLTETPSPLFFTLQGELSFPALYRHYRLFGVIKTLTRLWQEKKHYKADPRFKELPISSSLLFSMQPVGNTTSQANYLYQDNFHVMTHSNLPSDYVVTSISEILPPYQKYLKYNTHIIKGHANNAPRITIEAYLNLQNPTLFLSFYKIMTNEVIYVFYPN